MYPLERTFLFPSFYDLSVLARVLISRFKFALHQVLNWRGLQLHAKVRLNLRLSDSGTGYIPASGSG
jgi:hypothetical protein